ncbi:MAG TPA: neutral/alkaline non-lysosomal ceramidase N-terminal domain-containing protein, partial [Myxococcota bacterium]|nr:neutral/alkaline non-lysosomal ceramidase N-terminal domain-containing protein [Myxococcota bacterium]
MRVGWVLALALAGCQGSGSDDGTDYPDLVAGAPVVGAAEGTLKLPLGTPLSGFTARCGCFGGFSRQDDRDSAYTSDFVESTGVHVRPTIKVIWVTNGDEHLVMTKTDTIYSFDGLVDAITARLEERTGLTLQGRVTHSGNHNHSSFGDFSDHIGFYLGSDKFNREVFERFADQVADVAMEAWDGRRPASIGMGWAKDWDPDDKVYSDRRGDNDGLVVWPDMGEEQWRKDPYMHVVRFDDAETADPLAVLLAWGMHPYVFGEDMSMATGDATALVETEVAESFDSKVVAMFLQTGAGDASVRGSDDGWARMETVGVYARDAVLDLWSSIETSSAPITLEAISRSTPMNLNRVRVTRNGAVNWYYPPFNPDREADDVVYDEDGQIITPLDEFNTDYGAAFCGSGDFDFPVGGMPTDAPEYTSCMNITLLMGLIKGFFELTDEDVTLPLQGMKQVYTGLARLGPLPVVYADGTRATEDTLWGFFPGEPLHMFTEQWRRRALAELGYRNAVAFGYSMDHEGYLAIPEDWLQGGYEPDISFWGPLGAEYIMESALHDAEDILGTDQKEGHDPSRGVERYAERPLPTLQPDLTPTAGTALTMATVPAYYWIPDGFELDLDIPERVKRVQGVIQVGWQGGDPGVDDPRVTLEREVAADRWEPVRSHAGREINDDYHDFGIGWTPDPLYPAEAEQTHYWWATWQAVSHVQDRPGLPLGRYRLHIQGKRYTGGNTTWPWTNTEGYELYSQAFEVVPADVTVSEGDGGFWLSLVGPGDGFRMIDIDGRSKGDNPLRGELVVTWETDAGTHEQRVDAGVPSGGRSWLAAPAGEVVSRVTVSD